MSRPKQPAPKQSALHESLPVGSTERSVLRSQIHPRVSHGGPQSRGKRKTIRPFTEKAPIHLVLSSKRARGAWGFLKRKNHARIMGLIYTYADRFKVRVYRARLNPQEIQLLVKAKTRKGLADFLRVLAGRVAVALTGAQKQVRKVGKFWNELCWSRLIQWGAEFFGVQEALASDESPPVTDSHGSNALSRKSGVPETGFF